MDRYTNKSGNEYTLNAGVNQGDALQRLGKFEDMYDALMQEQHTIVSKMEALKADGKSDTATYKQLFANRLKNTELLGKISIFID